MVIVAFPSASAAERERFQETLGRLCDHDAENICGEVGIVSLKATADANLASAIAAYGK